MPTCPLKSPSVSFPSAHTCLQQLLQHMVATFKAASIDSPKLSAEVLLAHALGIDRADLLKEYVLRPSQTLTEQQVQLARASTHRRQQGEPVAYITGVKEFYGRDFSVTQATLIPRPETELLIDTALSFMRNPPPNLPSFFADLGTGSGCIAVTLALEIPAWHGIAVDASSQALTIAKKNAQHLGATCVTFQQQNFYHSSFKAGELGLITANPPYVSPHEYTELSHEVRLFEPASALVSQHHLNNVPHCLQNPSPNPDSQARPTKEDTTHLPLTLEGAEDIVCILTLAEQALSLGGLLLIEIGHLQGEFVLQHAKTLFGQAFIQQDLAGLDRLLVAHKQ